MRVTPSQRLLRIVLILLFGIGIGALYDPVGGLLRASLVEIKNFAAGHPLEPDTSVWQKIQNDLGIAPWRITREVEIPAEYDYQTARPATSLTKSFTDSELQLFVDQNSELLAGYTGLLVKTQVQSHRGFSHRLLLVGFDGVIHREIPLDENSPCDCIESSPLNYFHIKGDPAKLEQTGNRLARINSCGSNDWTIDSRYGFHHYLNNDDDHNQDHFWILDATDLVQVTTDNGSILQRISLSEIINANPNLPIFESRLIGTREGRWQYGETDFSPLGRTHAEVAYADPDPFHTNDIDEYRGTDSGLFQPGDLAISMRSQNLLIVVRPDSRKIIWYAYGLTSRQHDPDFVSANKIIVYDNNFHNPESRIFELIAGANQNSDAMFSTQRRILVDRFDGNAFHQLTEGFQFLAADSRLLVFSAGYYNVGVDLSNKSAVFAIRHRWQEQAYLNLEVERLLSSEAFDEILLARCQ